MTKHSRLSIDPDRAWDAVVARNDGFADRFVYAVRTTGVYCIPGCPSRRPNRRNVRFFPSAEAAETAGFRACKRCRPQHPDSGDGLPARRAIERARAYLDERLRETVTLDELGEAVGLSPFHLQRTFKKYVGLTPRQYVALQRAEVLRARLDEGAEVGRATYEAGYSSPSRMYEQADAHLGMTPGAYRRDGDGMRIRWASADTSLGCLLVAATERGVCAVRLGDEPGALARELEEEHPRADVAPGGERLHDWLEAIVEFVEGDVRRLDLPLDVVATTFQWRVWSALREIPYGERRTYGEIAEAVGSPGAARAVGRACAENPVALVIPCHRVVRKNGDEGGYRWGEERKRRLLDRESGEGREPSSERRRQG